MLCLRSVERGTGNLNIRGELSESSGSLKLDVFLRIFRILLSLIKFFLSTLNLSLQLSGSFVNFGIGTFGLTFDCCLQVPGILFLIADSEPREG